MGVDCLTCGRANVTFADSVDLCNRVHCGAFDHWKRSVPKPETKTDVDDYWIECRDAYDAGDRICNYINSLDTEALTADRVRSSIYGFALRLRSPSGVKPGAQSRTDSAIEVALNILIGATVSLTAQALIFPAYGIHVGAATHIAVVWWFTVVSVARQYALRRLLNGRSPWQALKSKFS